MSTGSDVNAIQISHEKQGPEVVYMTQNKEEIEQPLVRERSPLELKKVVIVRKRSVHLLSMWHT